MDDTAVPAQEALPAPPAVQEEVAFKGFDKNLKCRDFQYEIGKTYDHAGKVVRCASGGFHACANPLDVLNYYPLVGSRFATVKVSGQIDRAENEDTKLAAGRITIEAEIKIPDVIRRAVAWVIDAAKDRVTTGNRSHAASTGDSSHAASTGDSSHAASTGYGSHAASTGYGSHAASTGDSSHAASTGNRSHAASTGYGSHAASTGNSSHAASTGNRSHAASTGYGSHAASTGNSSHAASTGNSSHAASTGYGSHAASTGNSSHAASTGNRSHAASTGYGSHAASTGNRSHAEAKGKNAIAASLGDGGTTLAADGNWLVLARYDDEGDLIEVRTAKVGTEGIEAGKRYRLEEAGFVVVED